MASNHMRAQHKYIIWSWESSQNTSVSSTNYKWDTWAPSPPLPLTLQAVKKPPFTALFTRQQSASIAITNKYGKRGSPCLKPLELWKKPEEVPLTKIENLVVEIHHCIHPSHFSPKAIILKIESKNDHSQLP